MKRLIRPLSLGVLLLALTACGETASDSYTFPVMLNLPNGMSLAETGQNPVMIEPGGDAVFPVELGIGFDVRESDAYTYADGLLTFSDIRYPSTVSVGVSFDSSMWAGLSPDQIPTSGEFLYEMANENPDLGNVSSSVSAGMHQAATEITVTAAPKEGGRFVCWSLGAPVAKGGMPLAYTPEYTFRIGMAMHIYANFGTDITATLLYDANGGQTADGNNFMRQDTKVNNYIMPHSMISQGQLVRDGYVLYAYNTAPDGSGTEYLFGANVPMPENGTMMLYAQWLKADASLFTYKQANGGIAITGCSSTEPIVVLPETIDGLPVTTLAAGALNKLDNMTTLVTNRNLKKIEGFAVKSCPNFTTLYLCDSIESIPDNFYIACPEFQTLRLGAVRSPTYMSSRNGTYAMKYQRLIQTRDQKKIVIVSGSSSAYGIESPLFEELMGGEYAVVNYGTNAGTPAALYIEFCSHYMGEGDILLQAPEPNKYQVGYNEMNVTTWQIIEGALEAMQHVDIRNYQKIFSSLTSFNNSRAKMKAQTYEHFTSQTVNRWGDYSAFKKRQAKLYAVNFKKTNFNEKMITDSYAALLNKHTAAIRAKGGEVYLSFSPINLNSLTDAARTPAQQLPYEKSIVSRLDAIQISHVADYVMEGTYFFNSDLHLGTEGAQIRTRKLAEDLKAALAAPKN